LKTAYLWRVFARKSAKYGFFNVGKSADFQRSRLGIMSAYTPCAVSLPISARILPSVRRCFNIISGGFKGLMSHKKQFMTFGFFVGNA